MHLETTTQLETLSDCEKVIDRNLQSFIECGLAIKRIRDARLYRDQYDTFEAYCRERWGWSRQRAYQLIEASDVSTTVDISNEAQARELARVEPEKRAEVWNEAVQTAPNNKPTAKHIREIVDGDTGEVIENAVEVTKRPSGASSIPASKPVRDFQLQIPTIAINLPHDPSSAAHILKGLFDGDFINQLIAELSRD